MAKLAIKGHPTRGDEVIEILEMLGGINTYACKAVRETYFYFIVEGEIDYDEERYITDEYTIFTLEEFLEKYPYKVGNKVSSKCLKNYEISMMEWENLNNRVIYKLKGMGWYSADELQPYKEETTDITNKAVFDYNAQCCDIMNHLIKEETMEEKIKVDIPKGYEFAGVDDDKNQVVFTKIGYHYPKTYEECCKVSELTNLELPTAHGYGSIEIESLQQLLVCRDAYWKIAGEQTGLRKPWKPDWVKEGKKYCIFVEYNKIVTGAISFGNFFLAFPTEEMRNVFYENFKDLIELCKEFL